MDVFELTASLNLDTGDYENQLNNASSATNNASDSVGVFDIALGNLVAKGISSAVSGLTDFMSSTISAGDEIDKNSQRANMSTDTYQEWAHVLELGGGSASSLTTATKTLSNVITDAGNGSASASEKLNSIGLSYEQIAALSPEEQFEAVVYALADMEEGSERTAAAQDLLGRAGLDLIPTLNSGKDAIEEMRVEAHDLGLVLSEDTVAASAAFNDSLTNLKGAVTGIAGNLMGELMPSLQGITDALTGLVSGTMDADEATSMMSEGVSELLSTVTDMLIEGIPMLLDMATQLFTAILEALPPIIVQLAEALPELIDTVVTALLDNLPALLDAAVTFFLAIVESIPIIIDNLVEALPTIIDSIVSFFTDEDGFVKLVDATIQLFMAIVQAIPQIIVALAEAMPDILKAIVSTIAGWLSDIFKSALEIGNNIINGIKQGVTNVWSTFANIVNNIVSTIAGWVSSVLTSALEIGRNIINGIKQGVTNVWSTFTNIVNNIVSAITGWVSSVLNSAKAIGKGLIDGIKQGFSNAWSSFTSWITGKLSGLVDTVLGFFGIHSPSRVFAEIGSNLVEGMEVGFGNEFSAFSDDAISDLSSFVTDANEVLSGVGLNEISYADSGIGSLESAYGDAAAAGLTAQTQSAAGTTTIHTQVNIGGTKLGEIIYTLYNQQARIAGQPVFVYT